MILYECTHPHLRAYAFVFSMQRFSSKKLVQDINNIGVDAFYFNDTDLIISFLKEMMVKNILLMIFEKMLLLVQLVQEYKQNYMKLFKQYL